MAVIQYFCLLFSHYSQFLHTPIILKIAYSRDSRPAALSCGTDRSYKLLGRQLQAVLTKENSRSPATAIKVSKSRHNSRTKLRMKLLHIQKRDIVEFYLCCKFQLSPFSVRCETDVKDEKIAPQVLMPRGNISYLAHISCSDN